jgi:fatty-acyl-CoA synthase
MGNCPDYMAIWLGLTRIGVTVALVNTNLRGAALAHSIQIVAARALIVGAGLSEAWRGARERLPAALPCWAHRDPDAGLPPIEPEIASLSTSALATRECALPMLEDRALYIYTSGTTGLPKAAIVSHYRIMQWSHWFAGMIDTQPTDRMYNCLPLYHSVGGVVATGATLVGGGAVVLRARFSAREFWSDVVAERCTLFQYIGELCRYLVNSAKHPDETRHVLRLCCGNGLRADIWEAFRSRFRIPQILEYYASTEGNFSLYNCEGRTGAIGKIPAFLAHRLPVALVRYDVAAGDVWRGADGLCVRCVPPEAGEAIAQIHDAGGRPRGRFEGYADREASQRKVLRDVFAAGDAWYRTGDLMRQDEQGFFYFVDRVGDTFRWKGENVSTTEVTAVVSAGRGVSDAAVYGVNVPHADGRAGMAALVVGADFELREFRAHLAAALPTYARPQFLRIVRAIELTGTLKLDKQALAREGYDNSVVSDPLFVEDKQAQSYVPLDDASFARLQNGSLIL